LLPLDPGTRRRDGGGGGLSAHAVARVRLAELALEPPEFLRLLVRDVARPAGLGPRTPDADDRMTKVINAPWAKAERMRRNDELGGIKVRSFEC
jgi:hypothetical protein